MLALLLLVGCAKSILPLYEDARDRALADPGPAAAEWKPDAWLYVSPSALDDGLQAMVTTNGTLKGEFSAGIATLRPKLTVDHLKLLPPSGCPACITAQLDLSGDLALVTALGTAHAPVTASAKLDALIEVDQREGGIRAVFVTPKKLRDLDVSLAGQGFGYASGPLGDWIDANLLTSIPRQALLDLGGADLPLRAARVLPVGRGVRVEVLSNAPWSIPVAITNDAPAQGWTLAISQPTLLAVARAEAFRNGPLSHGVVAEPTALAMDGDRFTLGLRLWKIEGGNWWRDYTVSGHLGMKPRGLVLTADDVVEGERSPGAVLADPLAALAEGAILKGIEDAFQTTLPTAQSTSLGGARTDVVITSITAADNRLTASGTLAFTVPR